MSEFNFKSPLFFTLLCSCYLIEPLCAKSVKVQCLFSLKHFVILIKKIRIRSAAAVSPFCLRIPTDFLREIVVITAGQHTGTRFPGFGTRRRSALASFDAQLVFRRSPPGQNQQIPSGNQRLFQRYDRYGDYNVCGRCETVFCPSSSSSSSINRFFSCIPQTATTT